MSDIIDDANERAAQFLAGAIASRPIVTLMPTGVCYYCTEGCGPRLFCDAECRDAYDEEKRLRRIAGT